MRGLCIIVLCVIVESVQDKAEAKLKQLEARADEQARARMQADEEWRKQQRERELERLKVDATSMQDKMHTQVLETVDMDRSRVELANLLARRRVGKRATALLRSRLHDY